MIKQLLLCFLLLVFTGFALADARNEPIDLHVDLSDIERKIFHAEMTIPVTPGKLTMHYPKWIPGEHAASGPLVNLAGVKFSADGEQLKWRRDLNDMYSFHLTVPDGVEELRVTLDFLSPVGGGSFTAGVSATPKLAVLNWNQLLLYPGNDNAHDIIYDASLTLPQGWDFATALAVDDRDSNSIEFKPASLYTMVDSPVLMGQYFKTINITPDGAPPHRLNLAADYPQALAISDVRIADYVQLVQEAYALFGSRHYAKYDFLYTLSDYTAHFGLEHHESSDNRTPANTFLDEKVFLVVASLLPHEFVHSWNGKYRRPAGEDFDNYDERNQTNLLWVYEGLTTYWGEVLAARSSLYTPEQFRAELAYTAASMDHVPGRTWRSLLDTAANAQTLYGAPRAWHSWRRGVDFYPEGVLLWLDVDTKLRALSGGEKSLDDFAKLFYAPDSGKPGVKPYTFNDIVDTLKRVQPFDWAAFLRHRLDRTEAGAPLEGLHRSGWKLVYTDEPSVVVKARESIRDSMNLMFSIGLSLDNDGNISDVLWNGPAFKAGLGAGMKIIAVNQREFSPETLKRAITTAESNDEPITLLIKNEGIYTRFEMVYHEGLRYPHLVRIEDAPNYLENIIASHAK